jgi:hypothetical protein
MNPRLAWFFLTLVAIAALTALGPAERSLGANVRVVYLHGALVWAAITCIFLSAGLGLAGLVFRRRDFNLWSRASGRAGLIFWISYLPVSMWAMQTNWNGLYLAEPRWRVGLFFAIGGLVLQVGLSLIEEPAWASALNLLYAALLVLTLQNTDQVMHPDSPIFSSDAWRFQLFFVGLLALTLLAAWQLARWLHTRDLANQRINDSAN